jgi:hypothetical protein
MIVRNLLVLLPGLAALTGLGLAALLDAARSPWIKRAVAAAAVAIVAFNSSFALYAGWTVRYPATITQREALTRWLAAHPRTRFFLSPAARALLEGASAPNVSADLDAADRAVFVTTEIAHWEDFAANRPWRYRLVYRQMMDVNWDYYPTWVGTPAILDVSTKDHEAVRQ